MIDQDHIYRRTVDPSGHDSLALTMRRLRRGSEVLELGPATGYLTRALTEQLGCVVDAMEIHPAMAREAEPWCRKLVTGDIDGADLEAHFGPNRYDFVICADVLEHLRDPAAVLKRLPAVLKPHGRLIVSIPNTAYTGLILELMAGDFPYRSEGLLDRTHLRFYTRRSFVRLLTESGFRAISVEPVPLPYEHSEFAHRFAEAPGDIVDYLRGRDNADAYQFVIAAELADTGQPPEPAKGGAAGRRPPDRRVDVIVPVFTGMQETRRCLEAVLGSYQRTPFELLVINDASPDPAITAYLGELAQTGRVTLLVNPGNLGYTETVNRGIQLHPKRDVVLLNSDTEVANDWLDRLRACAYSDPEIGTATPFSNNATICSYPGFCRDNPLPVGWSAGDLDALFRIVNAGKVGRLPTAVGFATYLKRECLDATGLFDVGHFPRGYGEENDFCMRASQAGWRHALCADTFVFHAGGVSFGAAREKMVAAAQETLRELHPDYEIRVREHVVEDPNHRLRDAIDRARAESGTDVANEGAATAGGASAGLEEKPLESASPPTAGETGSGVQPPRGEGGSGGIPGQRHRPGSELRRWLSAAAKWTRGST